MAHATDHRPHSPTIFAYIVFGLVLGAAIFLVEGLLGVAIAMWIKAVVVGVGIGLFGFICSQIRKGSGL